MCPLWLVGLCAAYRFTSTELAKRDCTYNIIVNDSDDGLLNCKVGVSWCEVFYPHQPHPKLLSTFCLIVVDDWNVITVSALIIKGWKGYEVVEWSSEVFIFCIIGKEFNFVVASWLE